MLVMMNLFVMYLATTSVITILYTIFLTNGTITAYKLDTILTAADTLHPMFSIKLIFHKLKKTIYFYYFMLMKM